MKTSMTTDKLRENLEAVINGLMNKTLDASIAHEVSNAVGKYISTIKVDLVGEELKHRLANYTHPALTSLAVSPIKAVESGDE